MTDLLDLSDRVLRGEAAIEDHHPFRPSNELGRGGRRHRVRRVVRQRRRLRAPTTGCASSTPAARSRRPRSTRPCAAWDAGRLHTAVYTHGHIDHVFGTAVFEEESADKGWPAARVVGHEDVDPRFDRYILTAGLQRGHQPAAVPGAGPAVADRVPPARRHLPRPPRPRRGRRPRSSCHHARGETDDHTWVWVPERKVLCTGDLIIWCTPNAGQPAEGAALRRATGPSRCGRWPRSAPRCCCPATGCPVARRRPGARWCWSTRPTCSKSLHDQTLALMNEGARLDDILHTVRAPAAPARQAVPAPDLRRARVHRPQHLAALRRLVRRQPGQPQAGARRARSPPRSPRWPAAPARWPRGPSSVGRRRRPPPGRPPGRDGRAGRARRRRRPRRRGPRCSGRGSRPSRR